MVSFIAKLRRSGLSKYNMVNFTKVAAGWVLRTNCFSSSSHPRVRPLHKAEQVKWLCRGSLQYMVLEALDLGHRSSQNATASRELNTLFLSYLQNTCPATQYSSEGTRIYQTNRSCARPVINELHNFTIQTCSRERTAIL